MYVGVINMFNVIFGIVILIVFGGYFIEDIVLYIVDFFNYYMNFNIVIYYVVFFVLGFLRFLVVIYFKKNVKEFGVKSFKNVIKSKIKRV